MYQSDGARQCQNGGVRALEMPRALDGIKVYEVRSDMLQDVVFPAVCGGATPRVNVYVIDAKNLRQAQQRGFRVWPD